MNLITPDVGLFVWQLIGFLVLLFILRALAWKPILGALKQREESIQEALNSAESARSEMDRLKSDNERLLEEARQERDKIITEATYAAKKIREQASNDANEQAEKIIKDAREAIETEKSKAMREVKSEVARMALEISEKILRKNLSDDSAQKELAETYLKELNIN